MTRTSGPCATIDRGDNITFTAPILESCGTRADPARGHGIVIGGGGNADVTLVSPYFEDNTGWDIFTGAGATHSARTLVLNPSFLYSARRAAGYGAMRVGAKSLGGALVGGSFLSMGAPAKSISVDRGAVGFGIYSPGLRSDPGDSTAPEFDSCSVRNCATGQSGCSAPRTCSGLPLL